ncbi:DUF6713 family protein [Candidatus Enterococcus ferrettii]|uniref:Uncharacterized protein n=1 Tax=Candidatus Enterococcus ferrettii TaxID=2815324 RepID=A0ABV0EV55_9ENTE|nr:DUF6713 family protein [Enterococcus sp. 665A]MBO1341714.1 hypothetical protein [Enterococcus sp. 665A]
MELTILFSIALALLFIHEMDAIRNKEWQMFIGLRDLSDETAYRFFLLLHIPLYVVALFLVIYGSGKMGFYLVDMFLILHTIIHYLFRRHPKNKLTNRLSKVIINSAGCSALIHLIMFSLR